MTESIKKTPIRNLKKKIAPSYHIEADGCGSCASVIIAGVVGIVEYSSEEIRVMTCRECIKICGFALELSVFERKNVEIMGGISSFEILSKRRKKDFRRTYEN